MLQHMAEVWKFSNPPMAVIGVKQKTPVHFSPVFLDGLSNPKNYGGRILYVDSQDDLYIGTANPFEGCEVWRIKGIEHCDLYPCDENHYNKIWKANEKIKDKFNALNEKLSTISKLITEDFSF